MKITEIIIDSEDERYPIFKDLYPEIDEWKWNGISWWNFVYLKNDPAMCIIKKGGTSADERPHEFQEIFDTIVEKTYHKMLLLTTFYGTMEKELLIEKLNQKTVLPIQFHKELTSVDSSISMAFSDQVEILYRTLTGATPWEAVEFRRDLNKKNHRAIEKAQQIKMNSKEDLYSFLKRTSFLDKGPFFLTPNLHGAKILFQAFKFQ